MGTYYVAETKKDLIKELTSTYSDDKVEIVTVAHCVRGDILWRVIEIIYKQSSTVPNLRLPIKSIAMYKLKFSKDEDFYKWGYSEYDETSACSVACPLKYLELAPECNPKWREQVRQFHQRKRNRR